jgi:hypothetical protein
MPGTSMRCILERYFKPVATTTFITGLVPVSSRLEIEVIAVVPT